ncbi:MAG: hypothetical protein HYZ29_11285 [Myxococcales bacterium]|nr:hypothetical protein [Myxococcales bacterium]
MKQRTLVIAMVLGASAALWWGRPAASPRAPRKPAARPEPASVAAGPVRAVEAPAASAPTPAAPAAGPVFKASWGGAPDQLGRDRPAEGSPVGPMSFAADGRGRLLVLDNVNDRVVRRGPDGKVEAVLPIPGGYPEDVAWADDGSVAVLDRFRDKSVSLFDADGKSIGKLPLEGAGLPDPGSVTALIVDGKAVYAERAHGPLVKLGSVTGEPAAEQSEIPGRPSRDGRSFLNAGIVEAPAGRAYVSSTDRATRAHRFTRELRLERPIRHLLLLDSDRAGTVYFAAEIEQSETESEVRIVCLEPEHGAPTGTATLPANTLPEESLRDLVALPGGGVLYALRTEQGVTYSKVDCE